MVATIQVHISFKKLHVEQGFAYKIQSDMLDSKVQACHLSPIS